VQRLGPVLRLSMGLVVLTSCVLLFVDLIGLIPEPGDQAIESRIMLSETLATQVMPAAEKNDLTSIRRVLDMTVARNESVLSAGVRSPRGRLIVASGDHRKLWRPTDTKRSSPTHVRLPLMQRNREWGVVEIRFQTVGSSNLLISLMGRPLIRLILAVGGMSFFLYAFYMRRTLRHLDPSAVVPARVQHALDVLTEGVVLLDPQERIVLANNAFAEALGCTPKSLIGSKASSLDWKSTDPLDPNPRYPWLEAIDAGGTSRGSQLRIDGGTGGLRSFAINASPVLDGWGKPKGGIVTFHDVTLMEQSTSALEAAYIELEKSRDEIRLHAEEQEVLARRDPLTGVSNRRSFMEWAENELTKTQRSGQGFSCLMADIDHFKLVNDNHGHAMGDEVIRRVGELFSNAVRTSDAVCRYGGEEFCIAFPGAAIDVATRIAERLREQVATDGFAPIPVRMSFGIAESQSSGDTLSELLEHADKALYASKEGGRNRVSRWDEIQA
jgi:diguanylate cyclase (GGDEF)-like protein/PAS domain S-box-containing protein